MKYLLGNLSNDKKILSCICVYNGHLVVSCESCYLESLITIVIGGLVAGMHAERS